MLAKPHFLYPTRNFSNNIHAYNTYNSEGRFNKNIFDAIRNFAQHFLLQLLDLTTNDEIINAYCYSEMNEMKKFWDELLESGQAFKLLNLPESIGVKRAQLKIHSLDLIKGYYWFTKASFSADQLGGELDIFIALASEAIEYGCYDAGILLLKAFDKNPNKLAVFFQSDELENKYIKLAELYSAPGHLLLAKFYLKTQELDKSQLHLTIARDLAEASQNEFANVNYSAQEFFETTEILFATIENQKQLASCIHCIN
jgi:hypothetical protein